jgi:FkbM family methyltransferase
MKFEQCEVYGLGKIYLNPEDLRSSWIKQRRGTQKEKVMMVRQICSRRKIDLFIDVGANYGEFTSAAIGVVNRIICFEPNPLVFPYLNKSFEHQQKVTMHQKAIGTAQESCTFTIHKNYSGGGRLGDFWEKKWDDPRFEHLQDESFYQTVNVDKIKLSDFLKDKNFDSIFIKIDTEGGEEDIINSLEETLSGKNWFILYENNDNKPINFGKEIMSFSNTDILIGSDT